MFWTNYVYLCNTVNKSPNKVAADLGVSSSGTVTKWKNEKAVPRAALLMKIAEYFNVSTEDLLYADLSVKKIPSLVSEEEHGRYSALGLDDLTDEELGKVEAYIAGLKSTRKNW